MGELTTAKSHILFDEGIIPQLDDDFFEPTADVTSGGAQGRGEAIFFTHPCGACVLRHYRRGGLVARLSADRYLGVSIERSRPWREWHLLDQLYQWGLPVPRPIAARLIRHGLLYEADIVMQRIDAMPMADWLLRGELSMEHWQQIGHIIARFHALGLDHADLNARNILLDQGGGVYLIDLDRSSIKRPALPWQQANLQRLQRSLLKFQTHSAAFHYTPTQWQRLMDGYQRALAAEPVPAYSHSPPRDGQR